MAQTWVRFVTKCRFCGRTGSLSVWSDEKLDWGFIPEGFYGLAVNRHNPRNSVLRCSGCASSLIEVTPAHPG